MAIHLIHDLVCLYISADFYIYIHIIYFWNLHTILIHVAKFHLSEKTLKNIYIRINYAITHKGVSPLGVIALLNR